MESMYNGDIETLLQKPLLVLLNKCDSATFSAEDLSQLEEAHKNCKCKVETKTVSAFEGTGVASVLEWITNALTSKNIN